MTDLTQLRERVRAADGPDREIDAVIHAEFDGRDIEWLGPKMLGVSRTAPHDRSHLGTRMNSGSFVVTHEMKATLPRYTASIDSALALVERVLPDTNRQIIRIKREASSDMWSCALGRDAANWREAFAATAPLAILDALLTALIEKEG